MGTVLIDAADQIFKKAYTTLKDSLTATDATAFPDIKFEDVLKSVEEVQDAQRNRKALRNVRRIQPFLDGLGKYSKVIEVLCNGTPYLPYAWAPIKLMLQLADEFTSIFDQLADAYGRIGDAMPQFQRLQKVFGKDKNFQVILAHIYSDILEFHRRAYKFFRRRSWHLLFDIFWKNFQFRFEGILKSLQYHQDLLMKEVVTIDVAEARQWRIQSEAAMVKHENQIKSLALQDARAWLKAVDAGHDNELERLSSKRQKGTCQWVFNNSIFKAWKDDAHGHGDPILWVKGIPGAGKTILSTYIIDQLRNEGGYTTAYHICDSYTINKTLLTDVLRSIAAQFLDAHHDLAPYIAENYANKGSGISNARLRSLLPELLQLIPHPVRVIIDGLDEYPKIDQRQILTELLNMSKAQSGICKVLFSNRENPLIIKTLGAKPIISLKDQAVDVKRDVELYVHASLKDFRERFENSLIDHIERRIVEKSDRMFLWVRLVMQGLYNCHSPQELLDAVESLPQGLDRAYGRILDQIRQRDEKATQILQWLSCSFRPLKVYEIRDGIVLQGPAPELNAQTILTNNDFLELCKPLIEEVRETNTVDFVHYSAKEYILHEDSGPFLEYHKAQYGIALSCMKYMKSSCCFIDQDIRPEEANLRVIRGLHGLHHYANEFWFQHFLQYMKCEDHVVDDHLVDSLPELEVLFWKNSPGDGARSMKIDDTTSADAINSQLEELSDMPQAREMGLDILTFRKFLSQEKYIYQMPENLKAEQLKHDPTRFTEISQQYQAIVCSFAEIGSDRLPPGVSEQDLIRFKEVYLDSAFICRYRECPRYSDGFKSAVERDEHEKVHAKPFRCADPSCKDFARGFMSKTGLNRHNKKWHPLPEDAPLPEFEATRDELVVEDEEEEEEEEEEGEEVEEEVEEVVVPPPVTPEVVPEPEPVPEIIPAAIPEQPPTPRVATPSPPPQDSEPEEEIVREKAAERRSRIRESRAKKGKPVHNCNICPKVYTRAEGLRRHQLSHGEPKFTCAYEGCGRRFCRDDLLQRHYKSRHGPKLRNASSGIATAEHSGISTPQPSQPSQDTGASMSIQAMLNGNGTS